MILTTLFSLSRIAAVHYYYHAPFNVYAHLQAFELPRLALRTYPAFYPATLNPNVSDLNFTKSIELEGVELDLSPLNAVNGGEGVRLCVGKEWHRFPGHYLVPDQVQVRWIRSDFKGILPKIWESGSGSEVGAGLLGRATNVVPSGMNDRNQEEMDRYVC